MFGTKSMLIKNVLFTKPFYMPDTVPVVPAVQCGETRLGQECWRRLHQGSDNKAEIVKIEECHQMIRKSMT